MGHWKKVTSIPSPFANVMWLDVQFLQSNPDYGWICGYGGNVIRTTDGGKIWTGTKVQGVNQLESIHFADENIGYTSGEDRAYRSTDGGGTWISITDSGMYAWGVFFVSADTGMVVGGGCFGDQHFHRTTNGGKIWSTYIDSLPLTGLSDAVLYSGDGLGYAVSSGLIWRTTDGGITWHVFSISGNPDWQEEITHIGNSFLVPYDKGCSGGGMPKLGGLRMTTNNGGSWREFEIGKSMFGTFLLDSLRGWGCGDNNSVYYTSDGGINWELRNCGIDPYTPLDDIWFVNDTLGWVVGLGVFKTHTYDTIFSEILTDGPLMFCAGDSIILNSSSTFNYYSWSTGDSTYSIVADSPGVYTLYAYNHICETVYPDSVEIRIFPKTDVIIQSNKIPEICEGDSVLLWVENDYVDIWWSTLEKKDTITVSEAGTYYVTIIDSNGCEFSQAIDVIVHSLPEAKIIALSRTGFCDGDSVMLRVTEEYHFYYWFEETNPENMLSGNNSVTIFNPGSYRVIVRNEFGCIDTSDAIRIEVWDINNRLKIFAEDLSEILNFDTLGLTKMLCLPLKVSNLSDIPLTLFDIYITGNIEFSIPQYQLPLLINPGDTNKLIVCFRPMDFNERRDTLLIGDTCDIHIIPLNGYGIENRYFGESDCDVDLIIRTKEIIGGEYFIVGSPYPNPSDYFVVVSFNIKSKSPIPSIAVFIRNSMGERVSKGLPLVENEVIVDGISNISGTIMFETAGIPSGLYYTEIHIGGYIKMTPLIIYR
ncbi:WD40/YVTN/BNR-like repeat-containing protein [Bacteroidota bacterium]